METRRSLHRNITQLRTMSKAHRQLATRRLKKRLFVYSWLRDEPGDSFKVRVACSCSLREFQVFEKYPSVWAAALDEDHYWRSEEALWRELLRRVTAGLTPTWTWSYLRNGSSPQQDQPLVVEGTGALLNAELITCFKTMKSPAERH